MDTITKVDPTLQSYKLLSPGCLEKWKNCKKFWSKICLITTAFNSVSNGEQYNKRYNCRMYQMYFLYLKKHQIVVSVA